MATTDEAKSELLEDVLSGNAEEQIADRRIKKFGLQERYDVLKSIEADSSSRGPFIRVGFKGRPC